MKAVLETRCGCTRIVDVGERPPRQWRVPIHPDFYPVVQTEIPTEAIIRYRQFTLRDIISKDLALYVEDWPGE